MSRMFKVEGKPIKTWNPITGCLHGCTYCNARDLAEGRLKRTAKYAQGFAPQLWEPALRQRFHQGLVFVSNMGDGWGKWVPAEWILRVLEAEKQSPNATFLHLTKNPARYHDFLRSMPPNVVLGATIETNQPTGLISHAPSKLLRCGAMAAISGYPKMISIEPILDFDLESLVWMVKSIAPKCVYIGYDNHSKRLPEPSLAKTRELIAALGEFTEVRTKTLREAWQG